MSRVSLDEFLPFVMANCPDLPIELARAYIRRSIIEFAKKSGILKRVSTQPIQADVRDYFIITNDDENVVFVNAVYVNGSLDKRFYNHCIYEKCGGLSVGDALIHLSVNPERTNSDGLQIHYTACPTNSACEVDSIFFDDWREAIENGALARLFLLPNYSFTDFRLATYKDRAFYDAIKSARVITYKNYGKGFTFVKTKRWL
ncbi:hypothetical protein [Taylorella asinigenitalis]|uniref:Putative phage protein n=1 Tax=Taylorella asinigenitalis (strain MCE3) TaxID=1008459 RepID=G4QCU9_TAYAM|nr:hypothetical protein [Taylorella asinigenitalis]AEP36229.1 putative phage protein [Taylorella asinigenitalis MCE3]